MKLFFEKFRTLRVLIALLLSYSLFFPALALARKQVLPLALPFCFLLPEKNARASVCAHKSVQNIVKQYAELCGVHVIPEFLSWGDDHSEDPETLKAQATEACNLERAYPWAKRGAIQVFTTDDSIPTAQCKKGPDDKRRAKGCSNLCPGGAPGFSTVSGADCSPDISIHESGHSNCCGSQCHNEGDDECEPKPQPAGCNLCVQAKGPIQVFIAHQMAYGAGIAIHESSQGAVDANCQLLPPACESIRQGASPNPNKEYVYDPNEQYKIKETKTRRLPSGMKSIFRENGTDVIPLVKGVGDPKENKTPNLKANNPATVEDLKDANPRRPANTQSTGKNTVNTDPQESEERTTYTPDEMPERTSPKSPVKPPRRPVSP